MPKVEEAAQQLKILRGHLLGRQNIEFRGRRLSMADKCRFAQFFSYLVFLCRDLFEREFDLAQLFDHGTFDIAHFCKEVKAMDIRIKQLGYLSESSAEMSRLFGSDNWQQVRSNALPVNVVNDMRKSRYYWFYEPILSSGAYLHLVQGRGGYACAFRKISTWLNFVLRARLEDLNLLEDQISDYISFETELSQREPSPEYLDLTDLGARVLEEWIPRDFDWIACFKPKHGPGAIQELPGRWSSAAKSSFLHVTPELAESLKEVGINWEQYIPNSIVSSKYEDIWQTRIVGVPKALDKERIISIEHVELQYAQQGVKSVIDALLATDEFRKHCDLASQEKSQRLARIGSKTGSYITCDLSAASDSVTVDLVQRLTQRVPWLRHLVCAVRPRNGILPNGVVIPLEKFAPMGSGHCFRVEEIVFVDACEIALRIAPSRVQALLKRLNAQGQPVYWVYGDDIIIRSELAYEILYVLKHLNFKVNMEKSFFGTSIDTRYAAFREACGGEYLDGIDVTPLRIPRQMSLQSGFFRNVCERGLPRRMRGFLKGCRSSINTPNQTKAMMDFINLSFDHSCLQLRSALLADWRASTKASSVRSTLFAEDSLYGIKTFCQYATNMEIPRRYTCSDEKKPSYQSLEMKILGFRAKSRKFHEPAEEVISLASELNSELDDGYSIEEPAYRDYYCATSDDFLYWDWLRLKSGRDVPAPRLLDDKSDVEATWYVPQLKAVEVWTLIDPMLVSLTTDEP